MSMKFVFNPNDLGHRKLLALALRDFAEQPGNTISGNGNEGGKSLLKELERRGTPMSKGQVDRLIRALDQTDTKGSYPRNVRGVIEYLASQNFFPPAEDVANSLRILPSFFDGFSDSAASNLGDFVGSYSSYQYSNREPDYIVAGKLVISPATEWRYANAAEDLIITHRSQNKLRYEGAAFSDGRRNLYIFMREKTLRHPRFYLFDDIDRGEDGKIETIFGTVLAAGRTHNSHLSPVCLYRGKVPHRRTPLHKRDMSKLPKYVAMYLARPLTPGHSNAPHPEETE